MTPIDQKHEVACPKEINLVRATTQTCYLNLSAKTKLRTVKTLALEKDFWLWKKKLALG